MNYLRYKMKEYGYTSEEFAKVIGISITSFYKRMTEQVDWCAKEMKTVKDVLKLSNDEFNLIFGF